MERAWRRWRSKGKGLISYAEGEAGRATNGGSTTLGLMELTKYGVTSKLGTAQLRYLIDSFFVLLFRG